MYHRRGFAGFGASGLSTHADRFFAAQSTNLATARTLVDQAYVHAFQQNIPDRAAWQGVWYRMLSGATPTMRAYMQAKLGSPSPAPSAPAAPTATATPPPAGTPGAPPAAAPVGVTTIPLPPPVTVAPIAPPTQLGPGTIVAATDAGGSTDATATGAAAVPLKAGFTMPSPKVLGLVALAALALYAMRKHHG